MEVSYLYTRGGKEAASNTFMRHPKSPVLKLSIDQFDVKIDIGLSVQEAREIANELLEYANDVEEFAGRLAQ